MLCPRCGHVNLPGEDQCSRCVLDLAPLDAPQGYNRVERHLLGHQVGGLPRREVLTVPDHATVADAVRVMVEEQVGAVLVTRADGRLAGIFTERDLLGKLAGRAGDAGALPVADFMTHDPETVTPADSLAAALGKLDGGGYRHLPVIDAGRPAALVSVRDLMRHVVALCPAE